MISKGGQEVAIKTLKGIIMFQYMFIICIAVKTTPFYDYEVIHGEFDLGFDVAAIVVWQSY